MKIRRGQVQWGVILIILLMLLFIGAPNLSIFNIQKPAPDLSGFNIDLSSQDGIQVDFELNKLLG